MDPIDPSTQADSYPQTISEILDRLEIPASKIGLITAGQAFELLHGLDAVFARMQELEPGNPSRKVAEAQLADIIAKMRKEAARFIRDLGGVQALQAARAEANPPEDHVWWYLDVWLAEKRRVALKRSLVTGAALVVLLVLLAVVYNAFLAPDPQVVARYAHQQSATDRLLAGDFEGALREVNQGLQVGDQDPNLLVMKGVIQEQLGQTAEAVETYRTAQDLFAKREEFLLTRGQTYLMANQADKALADAEDTIRVNPQSASAYLLRGQVHEMQREFRAAMDDYNLAYDAADMTKQTELAAMARMRIAILSQSMGSLLEPEPSPTPIP